MFGPFLLSSTATHCQIAGPDAFSTALDHPALLQLKRGLFLRRSAMRCIRPMQALTYNIWQNNTVKVGGS